MGERADGNKIHAGLGDGPDILQIHTSAGLGFGASGDQFDRSAQLVGRHIIQQDNVGTGGDGLPDLIERLGFNFDLQLRKLCPRAPDGSCDGIGFGVAQGGQVIVLDEHQVEKAEAMVLSAAAVNSVFLQTPPAGCGFARVEDLCACAFDGFNELCRQGRDPGQALNEIQCDTFRRQDGACETFQAHERLPFVHPLAIGCDADDLQRRGKFVERRLSQCQTGHDQFLARDHDGLGCGVGWNRRQRGHIAAANVLVQRRLHCAPDFFSRKRFHVGTLQEIGKRQKPKNFNGIGLFVRHLIRMPNIIRRPDWQIPERLVTPEKVVLNRRRFLKEMGLASGSLLAAPLPGFGQAGQARPAETKPPPAQIYPSPRTPEFNPGWKFTDERVAGSYNNFYEFSLQKDLVREMAARFVTAPWPIQITGLIEKPMTLDLAELIGMFPLEERVYRLRCVEAWAMIVPWTGFPLSKLIERAGPKPEAKFVRFVSFNRPDQAPGMRRMPQYPWPYFEGLRMDEAMNPLTMVVTGIYGKPLPKQHGAPVRIVVPWKYGYKSAKATVKIEFVAQQPPTFWETLQPDEYPFESNVNPAVPHPRWSQATERMIDTGDRVRTQLYNGYGKYVAKLYARG